MVVRRFAVGRSRPTIIALLVMLLTVPSYFAVLNMEPDLEGQAAGSAPPTRGWLDIAVDGIEVRRPTQSNNLYPGQTVQIWVKLIHDERPQQSDTPITFQNQFTCVLVVDDTYENVTTQYKQVASMTLNYTGKDQPNTGGLNPSLVVAFYWTVPLKRPPQAPDWTSFQFQIFATITVDDDDKSDNYKSGSGIRVSNPEFSPFVWEEGQKEGDYQGPAHSVNVGETVFIPFLLQNRGPAVDSIGLEILNKPEWWVADGFMPQTVYPNDEIPLGLAVQIPSNPFYSLNGQDYLVTVRAYSAFYPSGPYLEESTHKFVFRVNFKPQVRIAPPVGQEQVTLEPGKKDQYVYFELHNTGNGVSSYSLTVNLEDVHKKKGWEVTFAQGSGQQQGVKPDEIKQVKMKVVVPEDAALYYNINIVLRAQLVAGGQTYEALSEPCTVFASRRYAALIQEFNGASFKVEPGMENVIKFNFTNMGNDKDPNQHLKVSHKPAYWAVAIDQSPLKFGKGLGPRSTTLITMTIFVPETSFTTTSGSTGRPSVIVQAIGGPYDYVLDDETFYFEVPKRMKLDLSSPEPEKEGFVGGKLVFDVNVRNAGNYMDTFNISVDLPWAELEREQVPVAPDETYLVKLYVDIPSDASADTNPDTPFPNNPAKNWYDGYKITISGYSQNETKKGSTIVKLLLTLHVQPFYSFVMELDPSEKPLQFSMDHDQERAIKVRIRNEGNIAMTVKLSFGDMPSEYKQWIQLQNTYIDVPDNSYSHGIVYINPRAGTIVQEGVIPIMLKGVARAGPAGEVIGNVTLELEFFRLKFLFTDKRMNNEDISGSGPLLGDINERYSFQLNLTNTGSVNLTPKQFDRMYIVLYDGPFEIDRANITYLPMGNTKEVRFAWTASTPGIHELTIALEGNLPISDREGGAIEDQIQIKITSIKKDDDDVNNELTMMDILIPLTLLVVFITAIFVFVTRYNQIFISPIDTGYDEKGEYRPWAVKERMKTESKQLEAKEAPLALPEPEKPKLPPAPATATAPSPMPVTTVAVPTMATSPPPSGAPQPMRAQPLQMPVQPLQQQRPGPQPVVQQPRPMMAQPMPVQRPPFPQPVQQPRPVQPAPIPQPRPMGPPPAQPVIPRPVAPPPPPQPAQK